MLWSFILHFLKSEGKKKDEVSQGVTESLTHAKVKVTGFSFSLTKAGWDCSVCGTKDTV